MKPNSLTIKSTRGIERLISTDLYIHEPGNAKGSQIHGIWDTGATGTAITKKVTKSLGLIPTGFATVSTANGPVQQNTFTIDVTLINGVRIGGIVATEVDELSGGCDALIGMDIINLGDFAITNHNGFTCMSFRVPSLHEIDYVKSPDFGMVKVSSFSDKFKKNMSSGNKSNNKKRK